MYIVTDSDPERFIKQLFTEHARLNGVDELEPEQEIIPLSLPVGDPLEAARVAAAHLFA